MPRQEDCCVSKTATLDAVHGHGAIHRNEKSRLREGGRGEIM